MAGLRLGPMLRFVDETRATIWVETDRACEVEVCGRRTRTFDVRGHHYALVRIEGLAPGSTYPYEVRLDGARVWPEPGSPYPPSLIRTTDPAAPFALSFGSCRVTRPHRPPYTLDSAQDREGVGVDALHALATRMRRTEPAAWPDALLLVGDQVYADEVSPETLAFLRSRRDVRRPPRKQIADFEEYCALYHEAWSPPTVRWLLSTLPTAMIFDDHDIADDWNTSASWRRDMQRTSWWQERITGGLTAYWLYQHLGNLPPDEIDADGTLARLQREQDGGRILAELARVADAEADGAKGYRWSYRRDHGRTRLIVLDSRCGRMLDCGRSMLSEPEWDWLAAQTAGDPDHLLIATSLPAMLPPAIGALEAWNEAVCDGAWGRPLRPVGELIRRAADLEHWAAFGRSLTRLLDLLREVAAGAHGRPPGSVVLLSGDVHYSYLAQARFAAADGVRAPVYQVVCSPLRNPIPRPVQHADRFARTRAGTLVGRLLAATAGVQPSETGWDMTQGPWFANAVSTLTLRGRAARLAIEQAPSGDGTDPSLVTVFAGDIAREPLPP